MERCRNCGQKTLATLDWACPWCGYPLKTGDRLDKTYSRLLAERRAIGVCESEENYMEPYAPIGKTSGLNVEETLQEDISNADEILVTEDEEMFSSQAAGGAPEMPPEKHYDLEQIIPLPDAVSPDDEPADTQQGQPVKFEPAADLQPPVQAPDLVEEPAEEAFSSEPEAEPVIAIDITVEELLQAYQQDDSAADAKYNNKILALTGLVAMINFRENRDIQYVNLTGQDQNLFQSIKCMFGSGNAFQLRSLQWGQPVVIRGRFKGSLTAMSLVDCSVIQ